jgi:NTP pyrophosphatase (non-canonical NTP hydrolase)
MHLNDDTLAKVAAADAVEKWTTSDWRCYAYVHLEVSEMIEAMRGKGDEPPADEIADVMIALLTLVNMKNIPMGDIEAAFDKKLDGIIGNADPQTSVHISRRTFLKTIADAIRK